MDPATVRRFLRPLILLRRHTRHPFEELAEERRVGEVQLVGYLVGEQVAVLQQHLRFEDDGLVDPLHDGASADVADDGTQVTGRQAEAVGVEGGGALCLAVLVDQRDETSEQFLVARGAEQFVTSAVGLR